jgi:hypothetical protein
MNLDEKYPSLETIVHVVSEEVVNISIVSVLYVCVFITNITSSLFRHVYVKFQE